MSVHEWFKQKRAARKRRTSDAQVPNDTGQARVMRMEAEDDLRELQAQRAEVESLARKLMQRRQQNHFGSDLSVTFRPRGGHS